MTITVNADELGKCDPLLKAYLNNGTLTMEYGGSTYTGCRVKTYDADGYLRHFEVEYDDDRWRIDDATLDLEKIEARVLGAMRASAIPDSSIPKGVKTYLSTGRREGKSDLFAYLYGMNPNRCVGAFSYRDEFLKKYGLKGENMKTSWEFSSLHPDDIDFSDIAEGLSRKHPLALVNGTTADGPECYVVVHRYLLDKAAAAYIETPDEGFYTLPDGSVASSPFRTHADGTRVYCTTLEDFPRWIQWAQDVKGAGWGPARRKASFTVSLPKV